LDKAFQSIAKQAALDKVEIEIIVALDQGAQPPASFVCPANVRFVESHGHSQCAALNAGVQQARGEYLAFLEDDDAWHPYYAATAMAAIAHGDFVSSTQLELDEQGAVVRINDFATPSGWTMPMSTWQAIGAFDETYRFHLDNDWLGRLTRSGAKRIHMVEATAPVKLDVMQNVRP
jgi:glycosyltransferase involved in cell wall biosynthesis